MIERRLESCDLRHRGEESDLRQYEHKQRSRIVTVCLACQRVYQLAKYYGEPLPQAAEKIHTPYRPDYGVLPRLTWPAPEFVK